ncbi:MAG: hypothetical protein LBJ12_06925 [Oscillospiraceae bacterium]|jgi:hypothetical protein|nr:hypothetical protein [Oscillospiraceae bacterium]
MPNRIHGIIEFGCAFNAGARHDVPLSLITEPITEAFGRSTPGSVPTTARLFKGSVTKAVNEMRHAQGEHVWQRGYMETVIHSEQKYRAIVEKIHTNPETWDADMFFNSFANERSNFPPSYSFPQWSFPHDQHHHILAANNFMFSTMAC